MNCFIKCLFIVPILVTFTFRAQSQGKTINISADDRSWYNSDTSIAKKVHLTDLTRSNKGTHWRFWYTKFIASAFVIEVDSKDSLHCKASITLYTYDNHEGSTVKFKGSTVKFKKRIYYKQIKLSSEEARRLFKLAGNLNIGSYTNREEVNNGRSIRIYQTLDAAPYMIEYADDKNYVFKACARPDDAKDIKTVLDALDTAINFERLNDVFEKNIPFEYFSSDQWQGKRKTLSDKQKQAYAKYWKRHDKA